MHIFLIDANGPFFRNYTKHRINWSKIPFDQFSEHPQILREKFAAIAIDLESFAQRVSGIGFNSVSFDDVAHLAPDRWLEPNINALIGLYQEQYRILFAICARYNLDVYITMDILSLTKGLREKIGADRNKARRFLARQVETLLQSFPEIKGIIARIGECDGKDVKGAFRSELLLRTPRQVNVLLKELLGVFEFYNRHLILRTWTVGAYRVGDFIWHKGTTARVLRGIDSPNFILSMKYGESDFFRYLPLNQHFFHFNVKKIIELQARREYEGCGEYPSFIGWDYEQYAQQLRNAENMVGICVWCQTGGWLPFRRLSFLEPSGIWNELNTFVTLKLFTHQWDVDRSVKEFAREIGCDQHQDLLELLRLSDHVIKELLYIEGVASQKIFFRRVRIPPLFSVFWNTILINDSVRSLLRALVADGQEAIESGYRALSSIEQMKVLAARLQFPVKDIQFMADTFALLALAREYYFLPYDNTIKKRIKKAKKQYKKKYPRGERPRYRIKTDFTPFTIRRQHLAWMLRISLRNRRGYRILDYLITLHLFSLAYRILTMLRPEAIPKFARKSAMGIGAIFR
jgi:hypothetical protein